MDRASSEAAQESTWARAALGQQGTRSEFWSL